MIKNKLILLSLLLAGFTVACDDDNNDDTSGKTLIGDEVFAPSELSAVNTGETLVLSFTSGSQSIEITTNDTISGTYEITGSTLKSGTLKAAIVYTNGTTTYIGKSGSITIEVDEEGAVAGTYDATVVSDDNIEVEIKSGTFSEIEVTKEEVPIPITEETINDTLTSCYSNIQDFIEFSFLFDAVYSSNVSTTDASSDETAWDNTWDDIYNHNQNSNNEKVSQLWTMGWNIISQANFVINNSGETIPDEETAEETIAEAQAIRAYTYYTLLTWFGDLPLILEENQEYSTRSSETEVLSQVSTDAEGALEVLPDTWSDNNNKITKSFAQGVLCRIYLQDKDYSDASNIAQSLIREGNFALEVNTDDNFTENNSESYWGFSKGDNEEFNTFFTKGDYIPAIRYTETLLTYAECAYYLGNQMEALQSINMLKSRRGENSITEINADIIFDQWQTELNLEGCMFNTLKRFEKATGTLQIENYQQKLPIPQFVLIDNPGITQNEGY